MIKLMLSALFAALLKIYGAGPTAGASQAALPQVPAMAKQAMFSKGSQKPSAPVAEGTINIQSWQTSQGAKVLFVARRELPMVDVVVTFDAGSARDGEQKGLANLTNDMLEEGAKGMSAEQIATQWDAVGLCSRQRSIVTKQR